MPQKIKQKDRIFLGSEGISERNYGAFIQKIATSQNLNIHIDCNNIAKGGDPLKIVQECIKLLEQNRRKREAYKHKFIILDSDRLDEDRNRDQQIPRLIKEHNIKLIYSNPNFECLILHHLPRCQTLSPPNNQTLNRLQREWPEYEKPTSAVDLFNKLGIEGVKNAIKVEPELKNFIETVGIDLS